MTDQKGEAAAAGSFVVPGDVQAGQLLFTLLGAKSQSSATTALDVVASDVPVQTPPQDDFTCPLDDNSAPSGPFVPPTSGAAAVTQPSPGLPAAVSPSPSPVSKPSSSPAVKASASPSPVSKPTQKAPAKPTQKPSAEPTAKPNG
ncbi:MAG: hypothetical protein JOZ81_26030 [Chloroflexi bacterium]|nr:hypothetical protein [Chloroflexota bacterium]